MRSRTVVFRILAGTALLAAGFPSTTLAQSPQAWTGVCVARLTGSDQDVATIYGLQCLIANILSVAITIIGLTGFVMIIYGAINLLVSGGQSKGIETGQKSITSAVTGLILALSAFIILNLLANFTGVSILTQFALPKFPITN